ncbi:putative integral membrane protein Pth11-like [Aspergillus clavatus NRRL 1]|uniref:Rhodopsin domain-containing protein n=1 Tax=Aspergillus clavatus (strain ATCC 1007 / CBS 513.65 / DSM 816 / NCTC 3887 / NRRL 1 / QM 1276 / 107) TaxID=344612 RepID=A1CUL5_ASPCL|nr:uncharacterized protein ACLA_087050 [Aspergillus clavatus NRRL 1]EAW07002.1 conserved hypothetical protein [Aspergillus clavatus NRRL 1]
MSGPFGEPPPGVDLGGNRTPRNNATVISLYILAAVAIALRIAARLKVQNAQVLADDWLIIAALILFAYVLIYVVAIPLIKISIVLFYRRIFGMEWAMWMCIFLTVGYWISCSIAFLVCCRPTSYYWTQYRDPSGGRCIFDLYPFYLGNAAANVVTDGIILMVPIPLVWRLQMRTTQKILVSSIFLLGGLYVTFQAHSCRSAADDSSVCVAIIVRIYFITFLSSSVDITWITGDVFIWSSVEPCVGIVCACLPTLQPLLKSALNRIMGSSRMAGKFDAGLSQGMDVKYTRRRQTGVAESARHRLFRTQEGRQRERWLVLQPGENEAILTTSSESVEMDSFVPSERTDGKDGGEPMSIRIHQDFSLERGAC